MKLIDVARSRSLTFTKHGLNIIFFRVLSFDKENYFSVLCFFLKKKDHTHIEMRETHTTTKKGTKKRKARELEEKYKQWPCVVFLSNTQNE